MIRKSNLLISSCLLMATLSFAQNLKPVAQKISDRKAQRSLFSETRLFDIVNASPRTDQLSETVKNAVLLKFRQKDAETILSAKPETIRFIIPTGSTTRIELELYRSNIFTPDFSVVTSSSNGNPIVPGNGIHYWGIIKGDNSSLAAISIFNNEVMGMISSPSEGNLILGKLKNDSLGEHILYHDRDLKTSPNFFCNTADDNKAYSSSQLIHPDRVLTNCIRIYWEINFDIFNDKGSVPNATNFAIGLFNQDAIVYANDAIPIELSEVFVWNSTSPYASNSTSTLLSQFQSYRNSFNGDLGALLGYQGGGGIAAGFAGLCASDLDDSQCYCGIDAYYNLVPVYSWSVLVTAHEQGHLMGSRHTHACVWNGTNTAIDGCGPAAGYSYEGSCSGAPIPPAGGTIMSYCHLNSVGINFSFGFGAQPSAVILNNYNSASCLTQCIGSLCALAYNLSTSNVTSTSATLNWIANPDAISFNIQYRISGTTTWLTGTSLTNSYLATGLIPGSNYEWQVQSVCSSGPSIFTSSIDFITIPLSCDAPAGLTTSNITSWSSTFNWDAVAGAVSYNIRYRVIGTLTWLTGTSVTTSYHPIGLSPNSQYEWQIQTVCSGGGTSSFTSSVDFVTLDAGDIVTIVLQPGGECGKDAVIVSATTSLNLGDAQEFDATAWTNAGNITGLRSLIQFDLSSIPQGSAVQNAFLSLYWNPTTSNYGHSTLSGSNDATLSEIIAPWDEHTVTWANQPATTNLNQVSMPASTSSNEDYINMDVTAMIQDFVNNPSTDFGMLFKLVTEIHYRSLVFASSDHPTSSLRPKLEITYAPGINNCLHLQYSGCNGVDAMISSCAPCGYNNLNYGSTQEFDAMSWTNGGNSNNLRSLIYWDLSQIPTNATVTSADVSLFWNPTSSNPGHSTLTGPNDATLSKITQPWNENTVTWNNQPATSSVNEAHMSASTNAQQDYINIDITALAQDMVANPSNNFGLMMILKSETPFRSLIFASSDHPDPSKHPVINVCYTLPTGVNTTPVENPFSVQENPTTQLVTVKSSQNFEPGTSLLLFNSTGQLIRKFNGLNGKLFAFEKPDVAPGIYFYQLFSKSNVLNGKLIYR